jgi:hypothetical protein
MWGNIVRILTYTDVLLRQSDCVTLWWTGPIIRMPTIQASGTLKHSQGMSMTENSEMKDNRNDSTACSVVSNYNPISEII